MLFENREFLSNFGSENGEYWKLKFNICLIVDLG